MPFLPMKHPEPIIHGFIKGYGNYAIDRNLTCPECGRSGVIHLGRGVRGCMRCERLDLREATTVRFEETESFRELVHHIRELTPKALIVG